MNGNINTFLNGREWDCRLTTLSNGKTYGKDIVSNFTLTTSQDSSKIIGATIGKQLEIELFTTEDVDYSGLIKLEIGIKLYNEETEKWYFHYFNLGQFYKAETVEQMKYKTKLICFDKMVWGFDGVYEVGNASDTITTTELKQHIQTKFGVTLSGNIPNFNITNPKGHKYRDLISYLAVTSASNTFYDVASNTIKFVPLVKTTTDFTIDKRYYFDYKEDRVDFVIKRVNLDMGGNFGYRSGSADATSDEEVTVSLPWATQEIADYVYNTIKNYEPSGYTMTFLGNPQIEMFDRIKLTTAENKVRYITVQSNKITFNGGLSQEVSATKMTPQNTTGSYVENKLTSKINVLSDKITMEVSDLSDGLDSAMSLISQTKEEILQQVQREYVQKAENSYTVILSNEFELIPTNAEGYPLANGSFECGVEVYNGSEKITNFQLSVSETNSYGITVAVNGSKVTCSYKKTTKITKNTSEITLNIKIGDDVIEKRLTWCVVKQGANGTSFNIKGELDNESQLPTTATVGDAYIIQGCLWVYGENNKWANVGNIKGNDGLPLYAKAMANSVVFLSEDDGETFTPSEIVLTPLLINCNFKRWEYYKDNTWKSISRTLGENNALTLTVDGTLFKSANTCTFKLVSDTDGVIDIITINKISTLKDIKGSIKTIAQSEVSQTAEQILSTVSKEYLKLNDMDEWVTIEQVNSAIDQKAESISLQVKREVFEEAEIGNVNLVLNSMVKETSSAYGFAIRDLSEGLKVDKEYTFTVNGRANSTNGRLRARVYATDWSFTKDIDISNDTDTTKYITFKAPSTADEKTFKVKAYLYPEGSNGTASLNWYSLQRGNLCGMGWTPAPQDIENQFGALQDMTEDLQSQVDGKIQTYSQSNNPATNWTTTTLKNQHKGDIWYDTTNKVTYRYSGTAWAKLSDADAEEAKSLASSKAQVFTTQPTPPYNKGDLWVQGGDYDGEIMRCNKTRTSGSYTASDWVKASKYTDDTTANTAISQISEINVELGKISMRVESVESAEGGGGRNLIGNSAFLRGTDKWTLSDKVTLDASKTFNGHPSVKSQQSGLTANQWRGASNRSLPNEPTSFFKDEILTASCWYYVGSLDTVDEGIAIEIKGKKTGSTSNETICRKTLKKEDLVSNTWTRLTAIGTLECDWHNVYVSAWVARNGTVWFTDFKLERGGKATDWTPSIEDTQLQFEALEDMGEDLQSQVDGKIETWYQSTSPATEWTTTTLKTQHKGDIWYDTTNKITYRWTGTGWQKLSDADAEEAKQLAGTKAKVFTSQPTPPYNKGDLWVQGNDYAGEIMRCSTARSSGSYTASDWTKASKYTDDTVANKAISQISEINVELGKIDVRVGETITEAISNLQIGGRNLLKNTAEQVMTMMGGTNIVRGLTLTVPASEIVGIDTTLSFDWRYEGDHASNGGTFKIQTGNPQYHNYGDKITISSTNTSGRFVCTKKISSTSATFTTLGIRCDNIVGDMIFTNIKLEKGEIATDWSPAPEDIETELRTLEGDLQGQLDSKIETHNQTADPSTNWTTTTLKTQHKGDLWYNPSTSLTKRWSGSAWVNQPEAETLAKTKKRVFTGSNTPTVPYDVGDLWVTSLTNGAGEIRTCKTAKTSSQTASTNDWVSLKYTDDTFAMQLEEKLDNLQIGSRNLIRNSAFVNGTTNWDLSSNVLIAPSTTFNGHPVIKSQQSGLTNEQWRGVTSECLPNKPTSFSAGETLTLSCWYKATKSTFDGALTLQLKGNKDGDTTSYSTALGVTVNKENLKGEWTRISVTKTLENNWTNCYAIGRVQKNGTAWFADFKLEKGNVVTDWSPAPEDTTDYTDDLIYDLQGQIDNKIETYNQTADPSTNWTTTELKNQHKGDLWYNPSTKLTKRWSGTAWVDQPEAETLAKSKRRVFTSTPTVPYDIGDLWVTKLDGTGEIKTCKKAKTSSQSYASSDWVAPKYTDDTTANQVKENLANNYSTTKQMESAITVSKNSILSTVSETYTTKDALDTTLSSYVKTSALNQTATAIEAKFSHGGTNLVRNSCFTNGLTDWENWGSPTVRKAVSSTLGFRKSLHLETSNTNQGVAQTISGLEVGQKYTLSAYVYISSGQCTIQVQNNQQYYGKNSTGTGKQWLDVTFTAETTSAIVRLGRGSGGSNGTYYFTAVQLERGELRTGWMPNANEIYEGITAIDQNGIEVSHSNINTKSKMSADGFSILDENGDTIAWLTSKNTWTEIKADKVFATNIDNVYMGDANLFVDHSKTVAGDGSSDSPFNNFKALTDYLQDAPILKKDLTINVVSTDNVSDHFDLRGIRGNGTIRINLAKTLVLNDTGDNSAFYFYGCDVPITINGGRTGYDTTDGALLNTFNYGVFFNQCKYGCVEYLAIDTSGAGNEQWGVIFRGTNGMTRRVDFMGSWNAVLADNGSNVSDHDSCGNCKNAFYSQSGANIVLGSATDNGYKPHGQYVRNVGCVTDLGNRTATASKRSTTSLPPTNDKWQSFSYSDYGYFTPGTDKGVNKNSWNPNGKKVYQGDWGYGNNRGIFTLPNSEINAYLSGATILDGSTITIRRATDNGWNSPQWIQLCGTTHTKIGTGTPPVTKTYAWLGELDTGQEKTFTLPKAFVQDLKSGVIKSVMFYTSDGDYYVRFDPVCTLNIKVNK